MREIRLCCLVLASVLALAGCKKKAAPASPTDALLRGDLETIRQQLADGAHINARDRYGRTLLHEAALSGREDVVRFLLAQGADVNAETKGGPGTDGLTPLHLAASAGQETIVQMLIEAGADVNRQDDRGQNALDFALQGRYSGDIDMPGVPGSYARDTKGRYRRVIDCLTAAGAEPSIYVAAYVGNVQRLKDLIDKGADVHARANRGHTPLFYAVSNGQLDAVKLLIGSGVDPNKYEYWDEMPLQVALRADHGAIAAFLIQHQVEADPAAATCAGMLHAAAQCGEIATVRLLLDKGADVNGKTSFNDPLIVLPIHGNEDAYTPLFYAAEQGYEEIAALLLSEGAAVNAKASRGTTPLHCAASEAVAALLLAHGADVAAEDKDGTRPLHRAAARGDPNVVELLIAHGADVNAPDHDGNTPMHHASPSVVELLVGHGADVNAPNAEGQTALHNAAQQDNVGRAKALIAAGADIDARTLRGFTPLHLAARVWEGRAVAEVLIAAGANIDAQSYSGWTPLHAAVQGSHTEMVRLLLAQGANPDIRSDGGRTALDFARASGRGEIFQLIRKHGAW